MGLNKVFQPGRIGSLELKNRLVVSAMVSNFCNEDGTPTEKYIAYHEHKARGGWGLVITEDYAITRTAGGFKCLPGLWDDSLVAPHRAFVDRVHAAGGTIAAQLYHAGRETSSAITGVQCVAPSAVKDPTMEETPRELTVDEIHELVSAFGDAARRAKEAGFDAVEVHGAHGYLVGQFVSPFSNKRSDEYGGSLPNRARFAVEVVRDIKAKCGRGFPVLYRMSVVEYVHGGLGRAESQALAVLLEEAGVDAFHCSQGVYASIDKVIPPAVVDRGAYVDNAAAIKEVVDVPVIAVGRINDIHIAESVLRSGKADFTTMARASLADPDMPRKVLEGREDDVIHCIGCMQGCIGENGKGNCIRCLANPLTGMEDVYNVSPAAEVKKVVVIGGGVSGAEAAVVAARRGHQVTLVEQSDRLGGQWLPASVPVGKGDFTSLVAWQRHQLDELGVRVMLNTQATVDLVRSLEPDAVVVATGSKPFVPHVPGWDADIVTNAHEVLRGHVDAGHKVVVVGGGLVGAETADLLASDGRDVTIVEMMPAIMRDGEAAPKALLMQRLAEHGVTVLVNTALAEIGDRTVTVKHDEVSSQIEDVDTVIIAGGVRADTTLADELEAAGFTCLRAGDANRIKNGYLGIREGFEAGLAL